MKRLLLASCLGLSLVSQAQQIIPCVTDQVHYQMQQQNPQLIIEQQKSDAEVRKIARSLLAQPERLSKQGTIMYIPVVFHVIHQNGMENITQAQIMDQIRILNEDFRKKAGTNGNKSTEATATDMEMEFRLAQTDPNGNRHDGINRIESALTENARDNVKSLIQWNPRKYLNVWVVKTISSQGANGTVLGFAQFPAYINFAASTDGIVIRADYVGNIQTGNTSNAGRTLTHEVGHWIGLYHTFQDGCAGTTQSDCSSEGDQVCDTPPVEDATFGCLTSRTTCGGQAMITNYMDYMDGVCANTYTVGQKARAMAQMQLYRSAIYSTSNLAAAGIDATGNYLTVTPSAIKAPYSYGFEDANITTAGWRIQNLNNGANAWKVDNVAFSGSRSLSLRNFNLTPLLNSRDEFNSPLIDLSTLSNPLLTFKVAYARKASNTNDILDVGISGDFGRTETRIFRGTLSNMETAGISTTEFVPTDASQWRTITVDLTPYKTMTNARIRFEFNNRKGNNIFIDDFSITNATGLAETLKQDLAFNVFPNPMNDISYVQFEMKQTEQININICDMAGRKISTLQEGVMQAGMYSLPVNRQHLSNGIYLVEVKTSKGSFAHKLVVN